jgi:hypothetical protein
MLRLSPIVLLLMLGGAACASPMIELKNVKPGEGCKQPYKKTGKGPEMCTTGDSKTRIWCPNGQSFERDEAPNVALSRSICSLAQIP